MNIGKVIDFVKSFIERVKHIHATELAAELAFYFLLSLFPFLIFAVTLLPFVGFTSQNILDLIDPYAPKEAMRLVEETLADIFERKNGGLLSFGIIATIWSASNAINSIIRGLNKAYEVEETRKFLTVRGLAILLTIGMVAVIIIALVLPVFGKAIGSFIFSYLGLADSFIVVWEASRWGISFAIIVLVFALIYYMGPNKRLKFKQVMIGGIFATVGWLLVSLGFSFYVANFGNYTATYGSLGGLIILMLWFYLLALIIILGGIINVLVHSIQLKKEGL